MAGVTEPAIQERVPLAPRSSLRVGGPARWFTVASSASEVAGAHAWCRSRGVPMVVLGGGTNVVMADAGLDALVVAVQLRGLDIVDDGDTVVVTAAAGELWDAVVAAAVARGGAGLECLSGIPGLAGGTPIQNVGAYGQDVSGVIEQVRVFDTVTGTTNVELTDKWTWIMSGSKDLELGQVTATNMGFVYTSECTALAMTMGREYTRDRDIRPSTTFLFQISFKNLE